MRPCMHSHRALLEFHAGVSLTARPKDWNPWAAVRPLTFVTLLERHVLLALAVTTHGLHNAVLPTSLVLDHLTQPTLTHMASYVIRHVQQADQRVIWDLHMLLSRVCVLLHGLLAGPRGPEALRPVGRLHAAQAGQHSTGGGAVGRPGAAGGGGWPTLQKGQGQQQRPAGQGSGKGGAGSSGLPAAQRGEEEEMQQLAMCVRRALVLLFTIAVNTRVSPAEHYSTQQRQQQQAAGSTQPPVFSPQECCWHVVSAATGGGVQQQQQPFRGFLLQPQQQTRASGLSRLLSKLPETIQIMLHKLRAAGGRVNGAPDTAQLGSELGRCMFQGGDQLLRLYRRSVRDRPRLAEWMLRQWAHNVEEWEEVRVPGAAARRQTTWRVAVFRLPEKLLSAAADDLVGGGEEEEGEQGQQGVGEGGGLDAGGRAEAPGEGGLAEVRGEGEGGGAGASAAGLGEAPDEGSRAAATMQRLGLPVCVMARLWLCRVRRNTLEAQGSSLQRARAAARAAVRGMTLGQGAALGERAKAYCRALLEHACPLQVRRWCGLANARVHNVQLLGNRGPGGRMHVSCCNVAGGVDKTQQHEAKPGSPVAARHRTGLIHTGTARAT